MNNTKTFITYNVCLYPECLHSSDSRHKTYSEAKQALQDKIDEIYKNDRLTLELRQYWKEKCEQAVIVEEVSTYTVV